MRVEETMADEAHPCPICEIEQTDLSKVEAFLLGTSIGPNVAMKVMCPAHQKESGETIMAMMKKLAAAKDAAEGQGSGTEGR